MNIYRGLTKHPGRAAAGLLLILTSTAFAAQKRISIPEEIEWTWDVRPPHPDTKLPNVLLLGDSISRNYFPEVTKDLAGAANVYLMASSTSVGDPRLPREIREFAAMEHVPFRVVHFNNGMHGWSYTEAQYKAAFPGSKPPVVVQVPYWTDCLVLLQQRQVAAISTDDAILEGLQAQDPFTKLVGGNLTNEPYGLAINKGHPEFVRFVNAVLVQMYKDGAWGKSYNQWVSPSRAPTPKPEYAD